MVAVVEGVSIRPAGRSAVMPASEIEPWLYEVAWVPAPAGDAGSDGSGSGRLEAPEKIADAVVAHARTLAAGPAGESVEAVSRDLDQISTAYFVRALRTLGWSFEPGDGGAVEALAARLGIVDRYHRWLARVLEILEEEGVVRREGEEWRVVRSPEPSDPDAAVDALLARHPESRGALAVARRCGGALAAVLRGEQDPLELLFPGGSLEDAESMYRDSALTRSYNELVGTAVAAAVGGRTGGGRLRVLEIGAGTGGTTSYLLPRLPAERMEYVFTDVSPLFVNRARERFGAYPFVRYAALDIGRDPEAQGFELGGYDLVIAANVLHATPDLASTVERVRTLLAPGGLLILLEVVAPQRFADLTVGLTDGWWAFTDLERRSYATMPAANWLELLDLVGFEECRAASGEGALAQQAVIVARAGNAGVSRAAPSVSAADARGADEGAGAAAGSWLILGGADGLGERLAEQLERRGGRCVVAAAPDGPEDVRRLIEAAFSSGQPARGVVHLLALDEPAAPAAVSAETSAVLATAQERVTGSVVQVVQALASTDHSPGLWLVTRGAQPASLGGATHPHAATLWGLARVIREEHPELRCVSVDLDPNGDSGEPDRLLGELLAPDGEDQVAWREGARLAARLVRYGADEAGSAGTMALPEGGRPFEMYTEEPGVLDGLRYRPAVRRPPGPGEVEIEVLAAGLNFRDVLNALGQYPGGPVPFGGECAGVVTAVGGGVEGLSVGDGVMALVPGSFRSHVVAPAECVVRKPAGLSYVEAASVPSAYATAWYTLHRLAGIRAGDRVLIHAAAGGVGMAAVRLAQRAGAEVFATAGSPAKRALLQSIGVRHVMNSRTLEFAEGVKRLTDGRGVDVVLNSLADEFIPRSLDALAEDGRFVEIGKRGIWDAARVAEVKPRATYHVVDLAAAVERDPALIEAILSDVMAAFATGDLEPLPLRTFPMRNAVEAFRYMAQARHTGKIVLTAPPRPLSAGLRPDGTYLITGGLGGLGLLVARWLVEHGARNLALIGRSAPTEEAAERLRELESAGARVAVLRGDVSRVEDVDRVLAEIDRSMPPLRGVIHASGVLDEGTLIQQDWSRFRRVFAPKVDGGWILHSRTRGLPLDFFVLFSSGAAIVGAGGLANHAAACSFLDALAHHRRVEGLPGLSIDWGQWSDVGAAAERGVADRLAARGIGAMTPAQGIAAFERIMRDAESAPQVAVLPVDWGRLLETRGAPPFFSMVAKEPHPAEARPAGPPDAGGGRHDLTQRLRDMPVARRAGELQEYVRRQAMKALGLGSAEAIDPKQPLHELGLDSLMAVELRNLLGSGLELPRALPATLVFDYPTVEALAGYLEREIFPPAAIGAAAGGEKDATPDLAELSEAEAEALLLAELDAMRGGKD